MYYVQTVPYAALQCDTFELALTEWRQRAESHLRLGWTLRRLRRRPMARDGHLLEAEFMNSASYRVHKVTVYAFGS